LLSSHGAPRGKDLAGGHTPGSTNIESRKEQRIGMDHGIVRLYNAKNGDQRQVGRPQRA
jgi:hypothetical protein